MKRHTLVRSLIGTGLLCLSAQLAHAAVFNIADGDVAGLINAINTANTNQQDDTVNLAERGTYTLTTEDNNTNGPNGLPVILNDRAGQISFNLTINGNGATIQRATGAPPFRILQIAPNTKVTINGGEQRFPFARLTFANGFSNDFGGGGIYNNQGLLTVNNCILSGNSTLGVAGADGTVGHPDGYPGGTVLGSGVYTTGGNLSANGCTFSGNSAQGGAGGNSLSNNGGLGGAGEGSAVGSVNSALTLTSCTFGSNSAVGGPGGQGLNGSRAGSLGGRGGGVYADRGTLTVCTFTGDSATSGGGIYTTGTLTVTLAACTFTSNSAAEGGGVYNAGTLTVSNSTLNSNTATATFFPFDGGGGIFNYGTLAASNCTLFGNSANAGGGIDNLGGSLTVSNCTLSNNSASNGGGIYNDNGASATLANTILKTGASGANIANNSGTITSQGHNLSNDTAGGDPPPTTGPGGFLNASGDMRNTDPQLDTAGLQPNGGPTQTVALLANSPAINAGNDANAPHRDQRAYLRNGVSDIGAFEYQGNLLNLISITRTGSNNSDITLSVEVVQGHIYRLERKANMTDSTWQNLSPAVPDLVATGNDTESITDQNAISLGKAFYHVIFVQ